MSSVFFLMAMLAAQAAAPATDTPAAPRRADATFAAGMRIALDPVTGEAMLPGPSGPALGIEEMQELARREAAGLVTVRNADGSETLDHEGRFMDFTIVRAGPGGRPVFQCVHGAHAARHAAHAPLAGAAKMEDR